MKAHKYQLQNTSKKYHKKVKVQFNIWHTASYAKLDQIWFCKDQAILFEYVYIYTDNIKDGLKKFSTDKTIE